MPAGVSTGRAAGRDTMRRVVALAAPGAADGENPEADELWWAWRRLDGRARYFFQSPEWIRRVVPGLGGDVVVSAIVEDGEALAAGLVRRRTRRALGLPFTVISEVRIGDGDGLPLTDSLVAAPDQRRGLSFAELAGASGRWDVALFRNLRRESPWLELAGADAVIVDELDRGVGVLDTSRSFEELWAGVSGKLRSSINSRRRRMERRGPIRFDVATGADLPAAYARHAALESRGWKGAQGTALAQDVAMLELHREFLCATSGAAVHTLHVGGTIAASAIGVFAGGAFVGMKIAHDESLSDCSPGNILLAHVIERCCSDPATERLDCVVWTPWLTHWRAEREPTYTLLAFHPGLGGRLARLGWSAQRTIASARRTAPVATAPPSAPQGD